MDTTRTDHHPNNPSHPTPRARDLRERLDSAADEGLSQNITRFLRFLGHEDGDVIELQTLGVPNKYAPTNHFTHAKTVEKAIDALEYVDEREPTGIYVLFNAVDPAVATRAASGSWHVAKRGESTTDRDVRARRALYIEVDAERTSGTSATDEELGHAIAKAADILAWLEERVPSAAIGVGHSVIHQRHRDDIGRRPPGSSVAHGGDAWQEHERSWMRQTHGRVWKQRRSRGPPPLTFQLLRTWPILRVFLAYSRAFAVTRGRTKIRLRLPGGAHEGFSYAGLRVDAVAGADRVWW